MEDFPWEILKVQTLQHLSQELGLARGLEKDEAVGFLKAVQRQGLGPALAEEITKSLATGGSDQIQQNVKSPPAPTSNTRGRAVASASARRISTRKRPAPESEPEQDARTEDEDTQEGSGDEREKRQGAKEQEPKSVSAFTRSSRRKRVKMPRVSDPGPPPARSTRSHGLVPFVSIVTVPKKNNGRTLRRTQTDAHHKGSAVSAVSLPEKRSTRRSTKLQASNADDGTDADADGEDEVIDEGVEAGHPTGPHAVVAALKKANKETSNPNNRGRTSKLVSASLRPRKGGPTNAATTMKSKSRPVTASQVQSADADVSISVHDLQTTKRTIRPTARGTFLAQKQQTSILSRPIRPEIRQRLDSMKKARHDHHSKRDNTDNEKPKRLIEVFEGVVLEKRCIVEPITVVADADAINGNTEGYLVGQSDEFVANGIIGQSGSAESIMDMDREFVLEREDISSLENDFIFRNISESTEDHEVGRLPVGEEDAEGEPEHETDAIMQDDQPQPHSQSQPQSQAEEPVQSINDDVPCSTSDPIPQLVPESTEPQLQQLLFVSESEIQADIQAETQIETQPDPLNIPQSIL